MCSACNKKKDYLSNSVYLKRRLREALEKLDASLDESIEVDRIEVTFTVIHKPYKKMGIKAHVTGEELEHRYR